MATKTTRSSGSAAQRHVRCYLCGHVSDVSHKALSTTCPKCHKAIKIEDVVVKNYLPVNDVQTCGTITVTKKGRIAARRIQAGDGVVCEGAMEGKLETAGPVQLGSKASWKGAELFSSSLKVDEGATLHGYVAVPCVPTPSSLVESKPLVRHVDPEEIAAEKSHADQPADDAASEEIDTKPAEKPLPSPKIISTRKAAVARAESTKTKSDAPLPTPKPAARKPVATTEAKPAPTHATAAKAESVESKPTPTVRKKTTKKTTKTVASTTAKTEATPKPADAKATPPPKVITTRRTAAERAQQADATNASKDKPAIKKKRSRS